MAEPRLGGDVRAALVIAAILTVAASAADDATLGMLTVPVVFLLIVYAMTRMPIRVSMLGLMFVGVILPNPAEGHPWGDWNPPLSVAGQLLLTHLNNNPHGPSFASFSGMDVFFVVLGIISYMRKGSRSKLDGVVPPTPKPLMKLAWLSLAGTAYSMLSGLLRGGDFRMSLWQLNAVMYVPIVFFLFQSCLRGPADIRAAGRVVLGAAAFKGIVATLIYMTIRIPPDPDTGDTHVVFATSHADSMLFADAAMIVALLYIERVKPRANKILIVAAAALVAGMVTNNRRLVWVHLLVALVTTYLVTADSPVKRKLKRAILIPSPLVLVYLIAGWNSGGGMLFKPVRMVRSVVDPQTDLSSLWREWENIDLIMTIRAHPVMGVGYGNGYEELIQLPAVSYGLERYLPHNSILGLLCYCGYFGYAMLTMLWVAGMYFAMRAYRTSTDPLVKAAAISCLCGVLVYLMHCWGDLGLATWTGVFTTALSIALAAKLASASGGWSAKSAPAVSNAAGTEFRGAKT